MYVTPYHFEKIDDINLFLIKKLKINDFRKNHDVNKYKFEKDINIFDLRYLKIKSYFNSFKFINNGLIINLEDIQADKGFKLIKTLNQSFKININNNFIPILKHTKNKKNEQNKKIIIKLNDYIVNHYKNENIENKIYNLKKIFDKIYFLGCW